jgi:osmoprotectant transport system ATP-binding protein
VSDSMIRLVEVEKRYPGTAVPAVQRLSLDIASGEVVVLVGPSGCGKTTTLKMINRLIEPTGGTITVAGRDVTSVQPAELRRGIGYVIQQVGLLPHRTIAQNIGTVPRLLGWDRRRVENRVDELIDLMDLDVDMRDRYPSELSGGQRQRVGVARALAVDPPVLLMDEPFGAVDPIVRGRLQDELLALQLRVRKTIVLVTHDIDEAIKLGDRIALLDIGGVLAQYATPDELLANPASPFVERFLGEERGLKRLSLGSIEDVDLVRGPVVDRTATVDHAREVMGRHGVNWVGVLRGEALLGWVWGSDLGAGGHVADAAPRPFRVTLAGDASLRQALDAIINTQMNVAVVVDDGRYQGMLFVDRIAAALR